MADEGAWVRVTSERELRVGLAIKCTHPDDVHVTILLAPWPRPCPNDRPSHWRTAAEPALCFHPGEAISVGHLYRLADDAGSTTDDVTAGVARELETVR